MAKIETAQPVLTLSAQHITGETVEDEDGGEPMLWIEDGETAVEISHEIGDDAAAEMALRRLAEAILAHADRIGYRRRMRTTGWT